MNRRMDIMVSDYGTENITTDSMHYMKEKDSRINLFERFRNQCEASAVISQSVDLSRQHSIISNVTDHLVEPDAFGCLWDDFNIVFTRGSKVVDAITLCQEQCVAVIAGVSGIHPGGGVLRGECTCEAELCRHSTLFFCLQEKRIQEEFYGGKSKTDKKIKYVYLPGVVFFDETRIPDDTAGIYADVFITDVPNDFNDKGNSLSGDEDYGRIISLKLYEILKDAKSHGINTLIICDEQRGLFTTMMD